MAARPCRGRPRPRPARRTGLRHRRQLADLEPDRWQGACHRRHQRCAHAALQHRREPLGRRDLRAFRHSHAASARGQGLRRRLRHHAGGPVRARDPDPGGCGRSAGGDGGPGLFRAGHDEIDLWHRLFRAAEHRRGHGGLDEPPADHHRLSAGGADDLCAGGVDLHRRCGGAMAARRAGADRSGIRDAGAGRGGGSGPGSGPGAGLHRAWGTLLAAGLPRCNLRVDAGLGPGRAGAGGAGERGFPDPRPVGGDAGGLAGCGAGRAAGGWRHGGERLDHAVPGRHSGRAGGSPGGDRDDGAWRGLPGGVAGGPVPAARGFRPRLVAGAPLRTRHARCRPRGPIRKVENRRRRNDGVV